MTAPIQSGDRCEVIGGLGRSKSPNIGLTVRVVSFQGEHTQLGRIWRCEGPGVQQLTDAGTYTVTGVADFAAAWLRKIEPDQKTNETNTANEVSA